MTIENFLENKPNVIKSFGIHKTDTGSSFVQIALLTERIKYLTDHMKEFKNDLSARRSLLIKVVQRNKLLQYIKKYDSKGYNQLVEKLGLKKK